MSFHWTPALHLYRDTQPRGIISILKLIKTLPAGDTGGDCGPFIVLSDPGPEGSIHDVSIGAGISDEGEVTDPALLAPEGGAAVVDPGCRGGVDSATSVEVEEVLRRASAVSRPVPVYRGSPAWT